MGYKVVYYDDLQSFGSAIYALCDGWRDQLKAIYQAIREFRDSNAMEGSSASAMKYYLLQVHYPLLTSLQSLVKDFEAKAGKYCQDYYTLDSGDGSAHGQRYTTIVASEVKKKGDVDRRIQNILFKVEGTSKTVSDLVQDVYDLLEKHPSFKEGAELSMALEAAARKATNLNSLVEYTEGTHKRDFKDIDILINQCKSIIDKQLGSQRVQTIKYVPGSINQICDYQLMMMTAQECNTEAENFFKSDEGKAAADLLYGRAARIREEEKDSRKWAKWIATGATVVVFGAVTIATAGGASAVGVTVIGAVTGGFSGMTSCFVDNYIETGSMTENLEYGKLIKDTAVGAIGGAFAGYIHGTKSVLDVSHKAFDTLMVSTFEGASKEAAKVTYDLGECVGGGIIGMTTGDYSVLQKKWDQLTEDAADSGKNIFVDTVSDYVGDKVDYKLNDGAANGLVKIKSSFASSKSVLKQSIAKGEKEFIKTSAKEATNQTSTVIADVVGGKYLDSKESISNDIQDRYAAIVSKTGVSFIGGAADSLIDSKTSSIQFETKKIIVKKALGQGKDMAVDIVEKVAEHNVKNLVSQKQEQLNMSQLWDETFDEGRKPVEKLAKDAVEVVFPEKKDEKRKTLVIGSAGVEN